MVTDNKQGYIVLVTLVKKIIGNCCKPYIFNSQTCFFKNFPFGAILYGFIELQMPKMPDILHPFIKTVDLMPGPSFIDILWIAVIRPVRFFFTA